MKIELTKDIKSSNVIATVKNTRGPATYERKEKIETKKGTVKDVRSDVGQRLIDKGFAKKVDDKSKAS